jgi:asparagine synthetase B (glutamine-hydrolysing)
VLFRSHLEQLLGHYTILLYVKKRLTILSDPLDTKHIFTNKKYTVFSSSLMAVAALEERPPTINREAFLEKCLTGLILSPDTIYNEVVQLNRGVRAEIMKKLPSLTFLQAPVDRTAPSPHSDGRMKSARCQAEALTRYLTKWKSAAANERVDLGLSGGYDSTLLFAASLPVFGDALHIHTHSTGHAHDHEKAAAMKMCELKGKTCAVVNTKRFDEMDAAPDEVLRQNLFVF